MWILAARPGSTGRCRARSDPPSRLAEKEMKIVADEHIPFLRGALEPFASIAYMPGRKIGPDEVRDADAILVRTRTRCDRRLLEGSRVRFIGSATIGFDHIDVGYCAKRSIEWANAPGCNASSVMQYVGSALACLCKRHELRLKPLTLGIVGAGHVGSRVEALARGLGMRVLLNDPPRARMEGPEGFVPLETILRECDIVSIHVPLRRQGPDRTHHLCDGPFFSRLRKAPFFVNTSRGEVVETRAIKEALDKRSIRGAVIDVWENEPDIDPELLGKAEIATPHIAGYSVDGKANGTSMVVRSLSRHFHLGLDGWRPCGVPAPAKPLIDRLPPGASAEEIVLHCIAFTYEVESDSRTLKSSPSTFEAQREGYPPRREFPSYRVALPEAWERAGEALSTLGFRG